MDFVMLRYQVIKKYYITDTAEMTKTGQDADFTMSYLIVITA
jgi:hypothetical protein